MRNEACVSRGTGLPCALAYRNKERIVFIKKVEPSPLVDNALDGATVYAKGPSHLDDRALLLKIQPTNLQHLFISQPCSMMGCSTRSTSTVDSRGMPMLTIHVPHVVCMRTNKEMCRTDASPGVTVMANVHPSHKQAVGQFISQAMRPHTLAIDVHYSIPFLRRSIPKPALVSPDNVGPETFCQGEPTPATHVNLQPGGNH
jgi:hypothetical protein